jgi:hypothetical protein
MDSKRHDHYAELCFPIVSTPSDDLIAWSPARIPHRLICGRPGSGKTWIARRWLNFALHAGWSATVLCHRSDEYSGVAKQFPGLTMATKPDKYCAAIAELAALLRERFNAQGTTPGGKAAALVPHLIVIDDFADVISRVHDWRHSDDSTDSRDFPDSLSRIFRLGRAGRIHIAAATSRRVDRGLCSSEALDNAHPLSVDDLTN